MRAVFTFDLFRRNAATILLCSLLTSKSNWFFLVAPCSCRVSMCICVCFFRSPSVCLRCKSGSNSILHFIYFILFRILDVAATTVDANVPLLNNVLYWSVTPLFHSQLDWNNSKFITKLMCTLYINAAFNTPTYRIHFLCECDIALPIELKVQLRQTLFTPNTVKYMPIFLFLLFFHTVFMNETDTNTESECVCLNVCEYVSMPHLRYFFSRAALFMRILYEMHQHFGRSRYALCQALEWDLFARYI